MSYRRPPQPVSMTLNLAPLVDVMMCLIIFFLLASRLASAEFTQVILPTAAAARQVESSDLGNRVTITVQRGADDGDEPIFVVADWDGQEVVERRLAPDSLAPLLAARAARAQAGGGKVRCVIRADRLCRYRDVEVVLRGCGLAGVSDVIFGVNQATAEAAHERMP